MTTSGCCSLAASVAWARCAIYLLRQVPRNRSNGEFNIQIRVLRVSLAGLGEGDESKENDQSRSVELSAIGSQKSGSGKFWITRLYGGILNSEERKRPLRQ